MSDEGVITFPPFERFYNDYISLIGSVLPAYKLVSQSAAHSASSCRLATAFTFDT